jgi:putative transposase
MARARIATGRHKVAATTRGSKWPPAKSFTCARTGYGQVWCFGRNQRAVLGERAHISTLSPLRVGTVRYMVFFVIELRSRAVQVAGIRITPDGAWMLQVARNLLDAKDGFLRNATHLVHDRDPLYTKAWTTLLKSEGVNSVPIPATSPNCNPYAERFVRTVREECLEHFVIFGERHLRYLLREFCAHYHEERFHQGLGGKLVRPSVEAGNDNTTGDRVECRRRLGGLLNFYHREAA